MLRGYRLRVSVPIEKALRATQPTAGRYRDAQATFPHTGALRSGTPRHHGVIARTAMTSSKEMRGREMKGWLRVDAESVSTKRARAPWAMQSVAFARALPPGEKK